MRIPVRPSSPRVQLEVAALAIGYVLRVMDHPLDEAYRFVPGKPPDPRFCVLGHSTSRNFFIAVFHGMIVILRVHPGKSTRLAFLRVALGGHGARTARRAPGPGELQGARELRRGRGADAHHDVFL